MGDKLAEGDPREATPGRKDSGAQGAAGKAGH